MDIYVHMYMYIHVHVIMIVCYCSEELDTLYHCVLFLEAVNAS